MVRHFVRISRDNHAIDMGMYPLGSCTMKHNPRLNEKLARLAGLAEVHPLQPEETAQGALELIDLLAHWLTTLCNMPAVAMSPAAGAHGELCGLMCIRAALEDWGDPREVVLVPESAHGTNPATAAMCGYRVEDIAADDSGRVDVAALAGRLGPDVAGIMLTNPNTCGLFENDIVEIAELIHQAGGYFYCDGANFNAIMGRVRPGDAADDPKSFGRLKGFHGQMGMFIRALAYMMSHGADGLRQAAEDAVLNANYIRVGLEDVMSLSYPGPCMHEVLFDDGALKDTGVTTLDLAKAMIDEGVHPMTMYFPLVVHGAMLIEPTDSESEASLDEFIALMRGLMADSRADGAERFQGAPFLAPRRRLDETRAARHPVLRWRPRDPAETAE